MTMERGLRVPTKYSWAEIQMPRTVDSRLRSSNFAQARSLTPMLCSSPLCMYYLQDPPTSSILAPENAGYIQSLCGNSRKQKQKHVRI